MKHKIKEPDWTTVEQTLLRKVWGNRETLKRIQAEYFPNRTRNAVQAQGARMGLPKRKSRHDPSMLPWFLWTALNEGPGSYFELLERINYKPSQDSRHIIKMLHNRAEVIYIQKWARKTSGVWYPIWAIGDGPDAPKPKKTGRTRAMYSKQLKVLQGNPFAGLLIGASNDNAKCEEDVCTG